MALLTLNKARRNRQAIDRPPDRTKPTPGGDVGFGGAEKSADCRDHRSAKGGTPQWTRHTSARMIAIVDAHRQAFPGVALPCDIQVAIAREWGAA